MRDAALASVSGSGPHAQLTGAGLVAAIPSPPVLQPQSTAGPAKPLAAAVDMPEAASPASVPDRPVCGCSAQQSSLPAPRLAQPSLQAQARPTVQAQAGLQFGMGGAWRGRGGRGRRGRGRGQGCVPNRRQVQLGHLLQLLNAAPAEPAAAALQAQAAALRGARPGEAMDWLALRARVAGVPEAQRAAAWRAVQHAVAQESVAALAAALEEPAQPAPPCPVRPVACASPPLRLEARLNDGSFYLLE